MRLMRMLFLMTSLPSSQTVACPLICVCDDTKLTVTCIEKNLKHIPPTIKEIAVKLDLKRNNLGDLSKGVFKHTPYLIHLNLQGCRINLVREGAFQGLSRLVQLDLTQNNIDILYQGFLNIQLLRLIHNSLNNLPSEAFAGLLTLSHLNLDHKELQFFPSKADQHMALQDLSQSALSLSPFISYLDLSYNQLPYIQALMGTTQLSGLNLTGMSDARDATCEERGHTKVTTGFPGTILLLNMRGNHFHYIPGNSFPNVPEVVSLHLDSCKIHHIEGGAFQGMKGLMYLYLSDNQLASLDTNVFEGAHEIMYLNLEGNRLSQFPSSEMLPQIPKLLERKKPDS
ncbi:hypothetical protein E1301_Tti001616 [Triplophysa tibetana]|uniref:Chondroadherin-like protein n=1 Tax=Triplophysa tibetana TaxID=1572043 RepID=A0A5A9P757_9TELE|nr:hypothetical protein E1301_Tti001616 [Triplophysa tibetana]